MLALLELVLKHTAKDGTGSHAKERVVPGFLATEIASSSTCHGTHQTAIAFLLMRRVGGTLRQVGVGGVRALAVGS
jgi:hypothetical protein